MKSKRNRRGKIFLAALLTMAMFLSMVSPSMGANGTGGIAGSADPGINAGLAVADTPAKVTASSTDIATVNSADSVTAEIPELKTLSSKAAGLLKAAPELNLEGPLLSSLAFGTTTAGTGLTCTEEFSSEKAEYKLVFPTAAASNLCIKPQMANSTDYKWRWIAVNNSTNVVTKSASALAFPAATGNTAVRIGTTTIAVGTTVTIDIVASGNDEEVLNSYTIVVLPQGTLTGLTVKYSTASANSTLSPTFNALTYSYSATINMASASGTINITPTGAGKEIKVNGQSATNGQAFSLSPADLFADGDSAVVTIDVGGAAENNLFEPHTYTLTLRKPTSVTAALGYISQLAVFESGTAPQYQVTTSGSSAVVSDAPVRYSWYINTENSIDSATPIDGATVNTYRPDVTDFDPGVYYHFAKVTSESGKSWTSDPIKLVVVPKVNPTIVTTNQPDLPKIEGVTYPEGVTKGYYYSESVEAKEYESFGVTPSFLGQIYDLTAPPYNCTFNYSWRRINASTGVTVYLSSEKGPTIKPISILGGWKYYCDVTYSISVDGASPLTSAAYPSETFYVHVQDPAVNEATEKQLSDLEISYVSDLRMEQNADCEPAFSPTTTEYVLAPNGFPNALYVNPKMENSENYRWIYTIAEIDGDIEVNSVKREFGSLTRLSWSNSAITVFPNYVNAGSYYGGLILKIKIVGAGDDDTIYGSYTVSLRERRFLSRIELKDSDGNDMPLLESGKYTSLSNATRDYSVLVDITKESFTITPTTLSNESQEVYIGGQKLTGTSYTLDTEDINFDENGEYLLDIVVKNLNDRYADGVYHLKLKSSKGTLKITSQNLLGYSKFAGTAGNVNLSVNATTATGTLSCRWYRNTTKSTVGGTSIDGATNSSYTVSIKADTEPGIYYYYCVLTNEEETLTSDMAVIKVYPQITAKPVIEPTPPALPEVPGITYASGYTNGYYYSEEVDPHEYTNLKVSIPEEWQYLLQEPWNATLNCTWNVTKPTGGTAPSQDGKDRYSPEITPMFSIGGVLYKCGVYIDTDKTYASSNESKSLGDTSAYIHIEDASAAISGAGSEEDPYLVGTVEQLAAISKRVAEGNDYKDKYIKLIADISLPKDFKQIGDGVNYKPFNGTFDGDGHTITYAYGSKALFGYTSIYPVGSGSKSGTIQNLNIAGEYIADNGLIGVNVGSSADIKNVTIKSGTVIRNSGLAGSESEKTLNITDCLIEPGVKIGWDAENNKIADDLPHGSTYAAGPGVGGFASGICGTVTNCANYGTVYGHSQVGGIVGFKAQAMRGCVVKNCLFAGEIIADGNIVGGILGGGYNEVTAPQSPCASIINCYSVGKITGNNKVGGIFGGENYVINAWANGIGRIQNNYFGGTVTATRYDQSDPAKYKADSVFRQGSASDPTYLGGIIGFMRSINNNNQIERNYYLETGGAAKGIGGAEYVDTNWYQKQQGWQTPFYINGIRYFLSNSAYGVEDHDGVPNWLNHSLAGRMTREDNPLGEDADTLAKAVTAAESKNGTVVPWLNEGENSFHNWIQGENYPLFSADPIAYELELTGNYKTEYFIGDAFDTGGMVFTATMSDGSMVAVDAKDVVFTGFDSSERAVKTVRASYSAAYIEFDVSVIRRSAGDGKLNVSFTLLGDELHDSDEDGIKHTLSGGGLTVWIPKTYYEVDENTTVLKVFEKALTEAGLTWDNPAKYNGNYIASITKNGVTLGEFTNGVNSGWMYTINGVHAGVGLAAYFLEDGDDIVFHYTDDYKLENTGFDNTGDGNTLSGNNEYTISFNSDGGIAVTSITVSRGESIAKEPIPTKAGYTFIGWYDGNKKIVFPYTPTETLTLKAKWSQIATTKFKVTVNAANGKKATSITVNKGSSIPKLANPKRAKYLFKGWYIGSQKVDFAKYKVSGNITLTAKWTKVSVAKVKGLKVTKVGEKSITLKWKKSAGVRGYVIRYSTSKKGLANGKIIYVSAKNISKTVNKLKQNKKYYFRVAAYKLDSAGKKVLGSYSATVGKKTKK